MRGVFVAAALGACGFSPIVVGDGNGPPIDDMLVDHPPDTAIPATWNVDPTSMKGVPESAVKWGELEQARGLTTTAPDHLWLMQDTSGSLLDAIGGIPLGPLNAPSYDNVVPGWTRHAVGTANVSYNQGFLTTSTGNLDGTSYLILVYVAVLIAPVDDRSLVGIGASADHHFIQVTSTPTFEATGESITPAHGTVNPGMTVHPLVIEIDAAHTTYALYTDEEVLSPAWRAENNLGSLVMVGNASIGAASARFLYGALWSGPHAEVTATQVKAMLQALGWTVTGY